MKERLYGHSKTRNKTHIANAMRKYGRDNFTIEVLTECSTQEEMDKLEEHYIETLQSRNRDIGYNIAKGGTGRHTKEVRPYTHRVVRDKTITKITKIVKIHKPSTKQQAYDDDIRQRNLLYALKHNLISKAEYERQFDIPQGLKDELLKWSYQLMGVQHNDE